MNKETKQRNHPAYDAMIADATPAPDAAHTIKWETDDQPDVFVTPQAYGAFLSELGKQVGNALTERT